ncbi:hypothetical protein [Rubrivirga litoralis]|uniref:CHAD domain-containing protein n=1 Tax=Rubrivirga litoralis TaxID=3075598 RepID=A0ABU3BRN1_9BACT|nr:hypothetical protein [Rubrivirga sp. F394]MDT0631945.1 hypothetical protein [Rubrivirga sp. F394]
MPTLQANPAADASSHVSRPTPEQRAEAKHRLRAEVALAFQTPVLPDDPFPERVTGRNAQTAERLAAWTDETREAAESLVERLREKPDDARIPDRTSTRLRRLAREWRVLKAFRQLHEAHRCPGIFHRLRAKADFLALCDREADSSAAGYGERQRRVLSKRGISHRHIWAEARRLAAEIGLLDDDPSVEESCAEVVPALDEPEADASQHDGDGAVTPEEAVVLVSTPDDEVPEAEEATCDLPDVRLDSVWTLLPGLTKAKLGAVVDRFGIGLWAQFGDRFYSSMRKAEMLDHTRRVVRHHACLDAAQRLTEPQVEDLYDWMRGAIAERYQRDADLHIAARLFGDFQASTALSAAGSGLSPDAWNRYRDAELRRIASFCYHHFYEDRCAQSQGDA